jgi:hypothetical protein
VRFAFGFPDSHVYFSEDIVGKQVVSKFGSEKKSGHVMKLELRAFSRRAE